MEVPSYRLFKEKVSELRMSSSEVTISSGGWSNRRATVSVVGVVPDSIIWVAPSPSSQEEYTRAGVKAVSQGTGTITFECESTPSKTLVISVIVGGRELKGEEAVTVYDMIDNVDAKVNSASDVANLALAHADDSVAQVNAILSSPVTIVGPITTANPITYNPTDPVTSSGRFQNLLRVHNPDIKNFIFAYCNYATTQNIFSLSLATPNGTQIRLELRAFEDDSAVLYLQNDKTGAKKDIVKLEAPNSSPSMLSMSSTFNDPSHSRVMDDAPVEEAQR